MGRLRIAKGPTPCPACGEPVLVCEQQDLPSTVTVAHTLMGKKPPEVLLDPKLVAAVVRGGRDGRDGRPSEVHKAHVCKPGRRGPPEPPETCRRCGSDELLTMCGSCGEER